MSSSHFRLCTGVIVAAGIAGIIVGGCTSGRPAQPPATNPAAPQTPAAAQAPAGDPLVTRARGIHERVITADTHDDINPNNFRAECNYTMRLTTQVNLPKMKEGGLDVSFMIAYVGQGALTEEGYANAYRQVIEKMDAVH